MKKYIPNILTFINLSFGILSIVGSKNQNVNLAAAFILGAALVDRYDGKIARMLNVSSDIGKELDSLADIVSFGVAPALLIFVKYGSNYSLIAIISILYYVISGCYRLARYNVSDFGGVFTGVPITISGGVLALISLIISNDSIIPLILMITFGYLMVSKFQIKKV